MLGCKSPCSLYSSTYPGRQISHFFLFILHNIAFCSLVSGRGLVRLISDKLSSCADLPTLPLTHEPTTVLSIPMSHTLRTSTSSSNFQLIFNNALKAYERRTKEDLLTHPLAAQLQSCDSLSSILIMLQQQVQELNQSNLRDEKLTKWLAPTVKVLYTFSGTLGEGVGLVCLRISYLRSALSYLFYSYFRLRK